MPGVDLLANEHENVVSKRWGNWLLSSHLTLVSSQSSSEILYAKLQPRTVFSSPNSNIQRKPSVAMLTTPAKLHS